MCTNIYRLESIKTRSMGDIRLWSHRAPKFAVNKAVKQLVKHWNEQNSAMNKAALNRSLINSMEPKTRSRGRKN